MNSPVMRAALALISCALLTASSSAYADVDTVVSFDPQAGETPESVAFDQQGNMYVSLALTGEIRKIKPNGQQSTLAYLPLAADQVPCENAFGVGIMGALTLDRHNNVYVSVASCDPDLLGVWKVAPNGTTEQVANFPEGSLPNGIAYHKGHLFVADSNQGAVWRVDADGCSPPEIWSDDDLLAPLPDFFPGPNGLQIYEDEVYVAVSDRAHIVAIPIKHHGHAGQPRVHADGVAIDDFAFDVEGNLYGTTDPFNTVVRVSPEGDVDVLLDADDGLDGPTSVAFGVKNKKKTLFIANASFPFFNPIVEERDPSIMSYDVGIRGYRR